MIRRPPRSTLDRSSAASDVYKRQAEHLALREDDEGSLVEDLAAEVVLAEVVGRDEHARDAAALLVAFGRRAGVGALRAERLHRLALVEPGHVRELGLADEAVLVDDVALVADRLEVAERQPRVLAVPVELLVVASGDAVDVVEWRDDARVRDAGRVGERVALRVGERLAGFVEHDVAVLVDRGRTRAALAVPLGGGDAHAAGDGPVQDFEPLLLPVVV